MSVHDDNIALRHILDHAREALRAIQGYTEQSLAEDRMRHLAVTRLLTIMGEAATRLSAERREELSYYSLASDYRTKKYFDSHVS